MTFGHPLGPKGPIDWDLGINALEKYLGGSVDGHMKNCDRTKQSLLRTIERNSDTDAPAILRRAAEAAVLHDSRLELRYDRARGEYQLGVSAGC